MDISMIFNEYVAVINENPQYIIGLLSDNGTVIYCSNNSYLGKVIPLQTENSNDKIYFLDNMVKNVSYVWISGGKDSLSVLAHLLAESFKTRIMYEIEKEKELIEMSEEDVLVNKLISKNTKNYDEIFAVSKGLGIKANLPRVAILIINSQSLIKNEIRDLRYKISDKQTFYSQIDNNKLLIFKSINHQYDNLSIKEYLLDFVKEIQQWGFLNSRFIIGTIQDNFIDYIESYNCCEWLVNSFLLHDNIIYFDDFIGPYIFAKTNYKKLQSIFRYYSNKLTESEKKELISLTENLYISDYNLSQTADKMFIHKNTLLYRIKKYEDLLSLNLRQSFHGKMYLYFFSVYLKQEILKGDYHENQ